jgi:hypothetical protein
LWAKGLTAKVIHKEIFPAYVGKCLSRKAAHNLAEKSSQGRSKIADNVEMDETTVKTLLCCGFRRTGKAMGQVPMLAEDMSRGKCFFQVRISHVLRFIQIFDLFTDSPTYHVEEIQSLGDYFKSAKQILWLLPLYNWLPILSAPVFLRVQRNSVTTHLKVSIF